MMTADFRRMKAAQSEIDRLWADRFHPRVSEQIEECHLILREEIARGLQSGFVPLPLCGNLIEGRSSDKCVLLHGHTGICEAGTMIVPSRASTVMRAFVNGKEVAFTDLGNGRVQLDVPIEAEPAPMSGSTLEGWRAVGSAIAAMTKRPSLRARIRRWFERRALIARLWRNA